MGDQSTESIAPGVIIADRYALESELGCGAMGSVWAAKHIALGSSVAIKFLHPETVASEEARQRFAREARIAATLGERCRYVVRVIDYGVVDDLGPFLVMEYLRGEELSKRLRREGRISLLDVVHIVAQLCRALAVAHHKGVVHRDVKPGNIFLTRPQTNMTVFVKLMDFGVAKLLDGAEPGGPLSTRIGAVVGTPMYMSPEQMLAQTVDHRSDLWGVASTVYRILTGEPPFGSGTLSEIGVRIVAHMPRPPTELVPGLPKALDAWFVKALAKSPDDRFQTARELSEAFAAAAGVELSPLGMIPRAMFPTPVPASDPLEGVSPAPSVEPLTVRAVDPGPRRHFGPWLALGASLLAFGVAFGVVQSPRVIQVEASLARPPSPVEPPSSVSVFSAPLPVPVPVAVSASAKPKPRKPAKN